MSRYVCALLLICAFFSPAAVLASECSDSGFTLIFVNGILGTQFTAEQSRNDLEGKISPFFDDEPVVVRLGYNPSHLGGVGDLIEAVTQAFGKPVSKFDLNTILMQIHSQVKTRKILLVGHSQGTFYTNEMYKYLVTHGVPAESITVYNVATPASLVAGGGQYLTSSNDKLINKVRDTEVNGNASIYTNSYYTIGGVVASALRSNITIPKEADWDRSEYGGHGFSKAYLSGAGERIVRDIEYALGKLKSVDSQEVSDGCFMPPVPTVAYRAEKVVLGVGDSISAVTSTLGPSIAGVSSLFAGVLPNIFGTISSVFSSSNSSTRQVAAVAQSVGNQAPSTEEEQHPVVNNPTVVRETAVEVSPSAPLPDDSVAVQGGEVQTIPEPAAEPAPNPEPVSQGITITPIQTSPGFGGGGDGANATQSQIPTPQAVILSVDSPIENAYVASTTTTFGGTADAGAMISASYGAAIATTTADGSGNWILAVDLMEGPAQITFVATVDGGNSSDSITRNITIDVTPPAAPSAVVTECAASLSSASCLLPTTTISIVWGDVSGASYYRAVQNGNLSGTTISTSSLASLTDGTTTTISVVAYDDAGNAATSTELSVVSITRPVIINEVAWGGDTSSANNQWIEIKNLSSYVLDASHLSILRQDGSSIQLSGSIAATNNPYIVVQPFAIPSTGSQIMTVSFPALSTATAEHLSLVWNASTTLDVTPAQSTCGGWCAGKTIAAIGSNASGVNNLYSPLSMERVPGAVDGSLASSWRDTDSYGPYIGHSNSSAIWGTPGGENSGGLPESGVYCGSSGNLVDTHVLSYTDPNVGCTYLMRFITGGAFGVSRYASLYRGTVGSSTQIIGHSYGKELAADEAETMPNDAQAGEEFFFALWENRSFGNDSAAFNNYFTQSASTTLNYTPPHGNYVTIPWTYQP